MNLGNKLKNIRYDNNISQEEMAKILRINRNYLSRMETNKSLPTTEVLKELAANFNISIDKLLELNIDDNGENKTKKIKKINQYCNNLSSNELDFIINILSVMTNHRKHN